MALMRIIDHKSDNLPVYFIQVKETAYEIHPVKKKRKKDKQRWALLRIHASGKMTASLATCGTPNECRDVAVEHGGRLRTPPIPDEKKGRQRCRGLRSCPSVQGWKPD